MVVSEQIPKKSLFRVEEICQIVGIKPYILRFWETEFTEITPISSSSGKKVYERKDLILISLIKQLLFDQKMTIEKAKAEVKGIDLDKLLKLSKRNQGKLEKEDVSVVSDKRSILTNMDSGYVVAKKTSALLSKLISKTKYSNIKNCLRI